MTGIELIEQNATPVLCIRTITSMDQLPTLIGDCYRKIVEHITMMGEQPADAPYTAYYNLDMEHLDVEMGFPVSRPLEGAGEILSRELPAGKAAVYLYKGYYEGMHEPYNAMFAWIEQSGLKVSGPYFEFYLNSPAEVATVDLLTRIVIPVAEN